MTISPARLDELEAALALLYGPSAEEQIAHARQLVSRGELHPSHLFVARREHSLAGAVFCQPLPGAIAVIWPPGAADDDPQVEDALTSAALKHVPDAKVVQAFLPTEEAQRSAPLLRAGFRRVTHVLQMETRTCSPLPPLRGERDRGEGGLGPTGQSVPKLRADPPSPQPSRPEAGGEGAKPSLALTLLPSCDCDTAEFERTLLHAHDDSLDCPELHGVRTPAEVLAGYRDCAPDPSRWWLARVDDAPAGVLILGASDLVFVGVIPERRGQGIGRALVEHAVTMQLDLSLIVDARNEPAIRVYQSLGFESVSSREVFLLFQ